MWPFNRKAVKKTKSKLGRNYGWRPDLPDHRDLQYYAKKKIIRALPDKVDLRETGFLSPVEDQKSLGSCTAQAWAGALEFLIKKFKGVLLDFSRLFIYYNERVLLDTVNEDSGAMIRDGAKTLAKQGCCKEKSWPYDITKFTKKPCAAQYQEALDHQILEYRRLNHEDAEELMACLADGFPFVFGFTVYSSFESADVALNGVAPMPQPGDSALGGHAVLAVGYDRKAKRFICRDSWGADWGQKGYFTLPFDYLTSPSLADDFWTVTTMEV